MPLPSVFGRAKKSKGKTIGRDTIYRQLNQNMSDDDGDDFDDLSDEEEHVVFKRPGDLELQLVPSDPSDIKIKHDRGAMEAQYQRSSTCLGVCAFVSLAVVAIVVIVFGVLAVKHGFFTGQSSDIGSPVKGDWNKTNDWSRMYTDLGTESCVRLLDVDGDGLEDIIFGAHYTRLAFAAMQVKTVADMRQLCTNNSLLSPCVGLVVALRGYDGVEIWRVRTRSEPFLMDCKSVDVNQDGRPDCLLTGRQATSAAIDPYEGRLLWEAADDTILKATWNTYQMVPLSDWNTDGVPELLLMNGGDPEAEPSNHNRAPGRIVVLSGKTGQTLNQTFMDLPRSKETYMTPVIYARPGGHRYLLLGSGGETVQGDLLGVSEQDLCSFFMGEGQSDSCPKGTTSPLWPEKPRDDHGIFVIYSGEKKGVLVPPVLVDMNGDQLDDIVVSAYDGHIVLLNGLNLEVMWDAKFPGMESYSSPAPGYFNNDTVLDFMIHLSDGAWPEYTSSKAVIIDGKDGTVIWSLKSDFYEMSSDLVLKTDHTYRDLFVYQVTGRDSNFKWNRDETITRKNQNVTREKRHGDEGLKRGNETSSIEELSEDIRSRNLLCSDDIDSFKGEVFVMDRTTSSTPIKIMDFPMAKVYYGISNKTKEPLCTVLLPGTRQTGAIGDVDGDGQPDYISVQESSGTKYDEEFTQTGMINHLEIRKSSIAQKFGQSGRRTVVYPDVNLPADGQAGNDITDLHILPLDQQCWTEYMGSGQIYNTYTCANRK